MQKPKHLYTKIISTTFLVLSLSATSQSFAKQYYKWVDHQGATHYTETPPPKNAKSRTTVTTYGHNASPSTSSVTPVAPATPVTSQPVQNHNERADVPKVDQQGEANAALQRGQERPQ
ncbi:DUF4124 domain-containing protein [Acinetobacter sichuanensis]|uniref:DUF4124 domain-containing protein n=1 Tax=Acinetobacter sichuanensis TaxID=2136183 RepID=A0A371YTE7_9GAMM|nr:DUF4124 domain-containing protein [Acinetobacter sichuanensis]RFC84750.1 DUF4124 domain-containing protein [Acinetobacter sichuanensis]